MTPDQIGLVRKTFAQIARQADRAGRMFYERLFELDPWLRPMFPENVQLQSKKVMQVLAVAVNSLDRLESILPVVQALGSRHAGYGVRDEHYCSVGRALLDTLRRGLGDKFSLEAEMAWTEAYITLAAVMKEAARQTGQEGLPDCSERIPQVSAGNKISGGSHGMPDPMGHRLHDVMTSRKSGECGEVGAPSRLLD